MADPIPVVVTPTPWWRSWTHRWNVIATVLTVLAAPEIVKLLGPVLGVDVTTAIVTVANIVLRQVRTGTPIAGSSGEARATGVDPVDTMPVSSTGAG